MKGFMCHPTASTVVCTVGDSRAVIVPRKSVRSSRDMADDDNPRLKMMMTSVRYSKLVDSPLILPNPSKIQRSSSASRTKNKEGKKDDSNSHKSTRKPPPLPSSSSDHQVFQIVVMRVSIHCQGCAGKLKKHLSKMEGVTSFSIELEAKRVTVMGNVSPIGVLESISKIKRAELWPLPNPNPTPSS
ncbi:Heavy metal transport/detoxification superfamily protein [Euphorbia peplus]|nr:Heavy metal transport/detoxification superfamily protein [Euphorbia peplus]